MATAAILLRVAQMSSQGTKKIKSMTELADQTEDNLLECKVCFEKYNQQRKHRPRNLPCGHVMCFDCIVSLAHPRTFKLECPFCRRACKSTETSDCLPLMHLIEILSPSLTDQASVSGRTIAKTTKDVAALPSQVFTFTLSFGGWGTLINPTGLATCQRSGCVAVGHDGKKRIKLFTFTGDCIQQFGERGEAGNDIRYLNDVTITLDNHIVITDSGDRSVKVFDFNGRGKLAIWESFCLPWGLDTTPDNDVIMTDSGAGTLYCLTADFKKGELKEMKTLHSDLCNPRKVAVSQTSGAIAVIEHLPAKGPSCGNTRLKVFSPNMQVIGQVDSFGLSLFFPSKIYASGVTFSREGYIVITDSYNQAAFCLGKPEEFTLCKPIITQGLTYPLALAFAADNSLIVLDGGDHSLKVYTAR